MNIGYIKMKNCKKCDDDGLIRYPGRIGAFQCNCAEGKNKMLRKLTANFEYNERYDKFMVDDDKLTDMLHEFAQPISDQLEGIELILASITQQIKDIRKQLEYLK